ncbi:hypothetical protein FRC18_010198 [Serendipita sp. 400]|nr:hypothetical protein FRC18_010198 [Serendipita sp. 400]
MSSSASSSTLHLPEQRPEADPLPRKIGEFGYVPPVSPKSAELSAAHEQNSQTLPTRHPADRDTPSSRASETTPNPNTTTDPTNSNSPTSSSSPSSAPKKARWSLGGVSAISLTRILLLLLFLAGTIAAWAVTIIRFNSMSNTSDESSSGGGDGNSNPSSSSDSSSSSSSQDSDIYVGPKFSSMVIVHVSFTVVVLVELLFLERSVYHARAERYLHKNGIPMGGTNASMGIAPWNRPPLPTYAAALAETGVTTGDVEDNLIAIPPPPAYGNTRGSVLLLAGTLRDSLVRGRNRSSQQSQQSNDAREVTPREMEEANRSRPISYDASEEVDNAMRARELEQALARLEQDGTRGTGRV